jgi:hypothetical protein
MWAPVVGHNCHAVQRPDRIARAMDARVRVFDPAGISQAKAKLKNVDYSEDPCECADGADAVAPELLGIR